MANNRIPRVPVREQDPQVRATNFDEVCYGSVSYTHLTLPTTPYV